MTRKADVAAVVVVIAVAALLWAPRRSGPIDLRWDGGVYYILGTSLAEGRGYRLLNEPGQIQADQYPPLLPAIVALHQRVLGTSDPTAVGVWLRRTSMVVFVAFALAVLWFGRRSLSVPDALLGALLSMLTLHAWFLSDSLYPELWFSIATLLFLVCVRRRGGAAQAGAYVCAVASYALRTVGITAFVVWVADSLVRRRFKEAAARALLALVPVVAWQGYVAAVERSDAYVHPAYAYQRAPYLFYNVSYARNLALRDPFDPAKGEARVVRRVLRNAIEFPANLGEVFTIPRGYVDQALHTVVPSSTRTDRVIAIALVVALSIIGVMLTAGGVFARLMHGDWQVPCYLLVYIAALMATPFPGQYLRYLLPVVPLLIVSALIFLRTFSRTWLLAPTLALQLAVVATVFTFDFEKVSYRDARGRDVDYTLLFYGPSDRGFDEAVDYLQANAQPQHIAAAGTPHWIYLRTGLRSVMTPFEADASTAERLLEDVPAEFLLIGRDVIASERFTTRAVEAFPDRWTKVFSSAHGNWTVYRRRAMERGSRGVAGS